jgi:hypothetical protein
VAVSDGQRVNAQVTNASFISRTQDSDTTGKIDLNNADTAAITDVQATINDQQDQITDNDNDISTLFATKQDLSEKDVANGYAGLDATGRIALNQLPTQALTFLGNYDAATNTPTLADGVGTNGDQYRTSVAGTQDLGSGSIDFNVGDTVTYNGTIWEKQDFAGGTDALTAKGDLLTRDDGTDVALSVGTDGQVLVADSTEPTGLKWDVAASGGTGINYIENPEADQGTTGWALYQDAVQDTPEDGDTGSPNLAFLAQTDAQLRGQNYFRIDKSTGPNSQGGGVSYDFAIDQADTESVLNISFDYAFDSGTLYANGAVRVFVYDVDNATLLGAVINGDDGDILVHNKPSAGFFAQFNTTDSLNYRLIFHVTTAVTDGWLLLFDNVQVGPVESFVPVSKKNEYETKFLLAPENTVTELTDLRFDNLEIGATYEATGFVNAVDTSTNQTDVRFIVGFRNAALDVIHRVGDRVQGSGLDLDSRFTFPSFAFTFVATDNTLRVDVDGLTNAQIVGDGTKSATYITLKKMNDLNTNVVSNTELNQASTSVTARNNAGTVLVANTTDIDFTEVTDSQNSFDGSVFTARKDLVYNVSGAVRLTAATTAIVSAYIDGGSLVQSVGFSTSSTVHPFSWSGFLTKGQTISFRLNQAATLSAVDQHWISINSNPDFTSYGVVNPNAEYLESEISSGVTTVAADTYVDSALSLDLTPGTWDIGYSVLTRLAYIAGSQSTRFGSLAIRDNSNNVISGSLSSLTGTMGSSTTGFNINLGSQLSQSTQISITENTTVKVSCRCSVAATNVEFSILGSSFTSGLTNPDGTSKLWARRVK